MFNHYYEYSCNIRSISLDCVLSLSFSLSLWEQKSKFIFKKTLELTDYGFHSYFYRKIIKNGSFRVFNCNLRICQSKKKKILLIFKSTNNEVYVYHSFVHIITKTLRKKIKIGDWFEMQHHPKVLFPVTQDKSYFKKVKGVINLLSSFHTKG